MPSLTLLEAQQRARHLQVEEYDVRLDLDGDDTTFTSTTTIRFHAQGPVDTFVDVSPGGCAART